MKQMITAAALLLAVLAIGITSCACTSSLCREMSAGLESARSDMKAGDWDSAEKGVKTASARWESSRRALGLITGDTELAAMDAALAGVESALEQRNTDELDMQIRLAVLLADGLRERERLSWHNVG